MLFGGFVEKKRETVQIGLRLEKALLDKVEDLSDYEGIDKMSFIRRAIASFIGEVEDSMADKAIEDYINLRIDEAELKKYAGLKLVPKDVQEARQDMLKKIKKQKERR